MHYFIRFSYDGSKFYGFQRLNDKKTVQKDLEQALTILNKKTVLIKGAGRTDIGVHANGQCATFDLDVVIPKERLIIALNSIVHPYIHVFFCDYVDSSFHARFSVKEKVYCYKIWSGDFSPFKEDYFFQYSKKIDIKKLETCCKLFVGSYDFHNFVSGSRLNYNATIYSIQVQKKKDEINIIFKGKGFYRYMVRNIVGALLDYNEGKCELKLIEKMLKDKNFDYQLRTAPAKGLYLEQVVYETK